MKSKAYLTLNGIKNYERILKRNSQRGLGSDVTAKNYAEITGTIVTPITPVDTGFLKRSWIVSEKIKNYFKDLAELINNADYASFVEYGHRTVNGMGWVFGRFYLTRAIDEFTTKYQPKLEQKGMKNLTEDL